MILDRERLWADFAAICDCGGRQTGTESEAAATLLLAKMGEEATGVAPRTESFPYSGWSAVSGEVVLASGERLPANPLLRSASTPSGGLEAEVIDLGRGTSDEFEAHRHEIAGRIVLVRHELMFAAGTVHRRLKYEAAVKAGAAGFLIAGPLAGELVAGSSGRGEEPGIPAAGISPETALALARTAAGYTRVRLFVEGREHVESADNLIFDLPGRADEWVVLSAHIDGHALGESALDNASGLAAALAVARALRLSGQERRRGIRLAFFNAEEWALTGSAFHVESMTAEERDSVMLNVNLDSVAGGRRLTALTSGFDAIEPFLLGCAAQVSIPLGLFRPLQMNSDHGNFARAGIPAFRLVDGFNDHEADARYVLTPRDRRDLATEDQLLRTARLSAEIVSQATSIESGRARAWRQRSS
ncbi:M28 family peptidase [Pseudaminobacter arsenicus]|uniref:Carboxypeptidase Q n=1 Tax=Borborobacter arsenicus TaxID=1851146 RepID=A0A432VBA4_9HYPH|nr:M20/M25/M40 family metallo-hydrolase [Pseudaminobacter arsenicus]RUM99415.1 M28 family peptidase [Pseudaminobacter arsenicus]